MYGGYGTLPRMPLPLIATDLDGTLLMTGSHTPHPDAVAAVHRALAAGIPVVFATGRAPVDVLGIADAVGHRWFAVCNDGAALFDLRSEVVERTHPIPAEVKQEVVARLRARHPEVRFLVDRVRPGQVTQDRSGLAFEREFLAPWAWALDGATPVADIREVLADPHIVKLSAYLDADGADEANYASLHEPVKDLVTAVRIQSDRTYIDFSKHGVSKASGVAELAELHGIDQRDVFAVGDLYNDVAMLDWAGFSFAVANAHPVVHEVADLIVPSNDEGGVAHVVDAAMAHLLEP